MEIRPSGPCPAKIMIVGEAPTDADIIGGRPFLGTSGAELSRMLQEAGIYASSTFMTTVVRVPAPNGRPDEFVAMKKSEITQHHIHYGDKFVLPAVRDGIERLRREVELCAPTVIVAVGNLALWALTETWGVASRRGSMMPMALQTSLPHVPTVVPIITPAAVQRQWSQRQIVVHDLRRVKSIAEKGGVTPPDYQFIIRPDYGTVLSVLSQLYTQVQERKGKIAVDLETRAGHIACIGLAWSDTQAICIPLMCLERPEGYWPEAHEAQIIFALYQLLTHENCEVIGQNFLYDMQYFYRHYHFLPNLTRDTMIAQHSMFSQMSKSLDFLSSLYCEYHNYWKDEGREWDPATTPEDTYWTYNCKDCVITFEVDTAQQAAIDQMGLREVHDFQQKLQWPVLRSMNKGLRVDMARRAAFSMELLEATMLRENWLTDVLGQPLNIRSSQQMQGLFYGQLGQKPVYNRKTQSVSCDDEALRTISTREPLLLPVCERIQELRSLGVFHSTFISAPTDIDGRMRCSFNVGGTETYRFSSSKNAFGSGLNLQNIPKGGGSGEFQLPNVRSLFIPDAGYTFWDIDLASADLRIVVWEADEPEFKAMIKEGADPYTEIAKEHFRDHSLTKSDPRRQTFKGFAHGTNYLGTAKGLAERLGLSVHEAEKTQKWYFERFPRIKKWQDDVKNQILKRRYVENVFGYRCYFFDRIEGTIFNQAVAWIPQSTVACIINRAYVAIDEQVPEVDILLQVHDSLAGQYPTHLGDWAINKITSLAEITLPYENDPMIIPVGVKTSTTSWGDCG